MIFSGNRQFSRLRETGLESVYMAWTYVSPAGPKRRAQGATGKPALYNFNDKSGSSPRCYDSGLT